MTAGISIYLGVKFFFLRKINWYIFWFSVEDNLQEGERWGGYPLPRRFSGSCMTWFSLSLFFFFFWQKMHLLHCVTGYFAAVRRYFKSRSIQAAVKHESGKELGGHEHRNSGWLQKSGGRRLDFTVCGELTGVSQLCPEIWGKKTSSWVMSC